MSGTTPNYGFPLEISGCLNCTLGGFNTTAPTLIVAGSKNTNTSGINDAIVPLYVVIFLLSVVGNSMVMVTLIQNKRMRTVTNVYLLNLAISDLLLGVVCMPFTLLGQILRNFVFGGTMCKLIPYFQAVSVSVGVWTLVAISLERYFAICRPLKSRRWQTQFHAYKMIVVVWLASLTWTSPILLVSTLQSTQRKGRHKCREVWPSIYSERTYNIFLDMVLLLVPLLIMSIAYSLIVSKLWRGLQREMKHNSSFRKKGDTLTVPAMSKVVVRKNTVSTVASGIRPNRLLPKVSNLRQRTTRATYKCKGRKGARLKLWLMKARLQSQLNSPLVESQFSTGAVDFSSNSGDEETSYKFSRQAIRSNYMEKSIDAKKKVIRMLFVIITEFFVCWAPIHVLNTWYLFSPKSVYQYVGSTGISLVQLLAYISSCCNPITYCFMNRKFRQAFLAIFRFRSQCFCRSENKPGVNGCPMSRLGEGCIPLGANNSDVSVNDSTVYVGRACASEVVVLDAEECV